MKRNLVIIGLLLLALTVSVLWNFQQLTRIKELEGNEFPVIPSLSAEINSFEACAAAGYPILESYPERCLTPDGKSFTRDISDTVPVAP